jgi:hypothetical protein
MSKENFLRKRYISRVDLDHLFDQDVILRIILEDEKLDLNSSEKADFARRVRKAPAWKLLAICVHVGLDMDMLRHFMEKHQLNDNCFSDPNLPGCHQECDWIFCRAMFDKIVEAAPAFFATLIDDDQKFCELQNEVMPLYHGGPNNSEKLLGGGVSGNVYEVGIDPTHTELSGVSATLRS